MTPGQARFALLAFCVVMIGVAINALFLQAPSVPAPQASKAAGERPPARAPEKRARKASEASQDGRQPSRPPDAAAGERTLRIARFAPEPGRLDTPPPAPAAEAGPETVAAIQRELTLRGYGFLPGAGHLDLATRSAIIAFEHDHALPPTGEASEALLRRILFGAPAGDMGAGSGQPARAEDAVRAAQRLLTALGYPVERIDGRLGEDTAKSIRDFELDKGLVPKGRVSPELLARLRQAAADPARR